MEDELPGHSGDEAPATGSSRPLFPRVLAALFGLALLSGYVIWRSAPPKIVDEVPPSADADRERAFRDLLFADEPAPPDLGSEELASLAIELVLIETELNQQYFRQASSKFAPVPLTKPTNALESLRLRIAERISKGEPVCQLPPCPMPPGQARDPGMPLPRPTPTLPPDDLLFDQAIQIARRAGFLFGDLAPQANPVIDPTQPLGDPAAP